MIEIIKEPSPRIITFTCEACNCVFKTDEWKIGDDTCGTTLLHSCPSCKKICGINANDLD